MDWNYLFFITTYFLWGTLGGSTRKFSSWLYNDCLDNIVFQICPLFPNTLVDWEDTVEVKAYQEWMEKKYKPFFTRIIPKDVALQWLEQTNLILQTIQDNVKMLEEKYDNEKK